MSAKKQMAELESELAAVASDLSALDAKVGVTGDPEMRRSLNDALRKVEHLKAVGRLLHRAAVGEG